MDSRPYSCCDKVVLLVFVDSSDLSVSRTLWVFVLERIERVPLLVTFIIYSPIQIPSSLSSPLHNLFPLNCHTILFFFLQ
jgi:hypothetical protein